MEGVREAEKVSEDSDQEGPVTAYTSTSFMRPRGRESGARSRDILFKIMCQPCQVSTELGATTQLAKSEVTVLPETVQAQGHQIRVIEVTERTADHSFHSGRDEAPKEKMIIGTMVESKGGRFGNLT